MTWQPGRIVSGGQSGVDRAGLDAARQLGIPIGGWIPKGRIAEDGVIAPEYPLKEAPFVEYEVRTRWNVRDSDATLILTHGEPEGGTKATVEDAADLGKAYIVVDLGASDALRKTATFLDEVRPRILNIAGPRESKHPGIYNEALAFLLESLKSV